MTQNHSLSSSGVTTSKSIRLRAALHVMSGTARCHILSSTVTFQNKAGSKNKLIKVFEEEGGGLQLAFDPSARAADVCSCKVFLTFHLDTLGRCPPSPSHHKHTPVSHSPFLSISLIFCPEEQDHSLQICAPATHLQHANTRLAWK